MTTQDKTYHNQLLSIRDLGVVFAHDGQVSRAVDGVSLEVGQGENVCLVGESGCGKTVTALSILGLIPQPPGRIVHGSITFQGTDLLKLKERQLQTIRGKSIGMVFQDPLTSLNPVFSIGEQIEEVLLAHEDLTRAEIRSRTLKALSDVGIPSPEERIHSYPHQLSGGQRQRAMIAMALICNPDLVIADEPTTALDVTIQAQILKLFKSIQKSAATSILYITHDLGVVSTIADRVLVMYAGVIVEQGRAADIFARARHPYTQGLLASLPTVAKKGTRLQSIPGAVPNPAHKPPGCPFHPRCFAAQAACQRDFPELIRCSGDHFTRCPVLACGSPGSPA